MMLKLLGAALIVGGCGAMAMTLAYGHRKQVTELKNLKKAIQEMEWELKYRVSPLAELCHAGSLAARGTVRQFLRELAGLLEGWHVESVSASVHGLLGKYPFSRKTRDCLRQLGDSLGRFDLEGQIQGLEEAKNLCRRDLEELKEDGSERLRLCQTLAVCGGAGLAILFI